MSLTVRVGLGLGLGYLYLVLFHEINSQMMLWRRSALSDVRDRILVWFHRLHVHLCCVGHRLASKSFKIGLAVESDTCVTYNQAACSH
jgi:hypothetical protein